MSQDGSQKAKPGGAEDKPAVGVVGTVLNSSKWYGVIEHSVKLLKNVALGKASFEDEAARNPRDRLNQVMTCLLVFSQISCSVWLVCLQWSGLGK
jgi:hypothetical protein